MPRRVAIAAGTRACLAIGILLLAAPAFAARPRVGLALGGGGARGIAHVGVLQWLDEHRIPIDYIAGTSMGGLVGGAYATGMSPEAIRALLRDENWDDVFATGAPYSLSSWRRKEDERDLPVRLELGLRHGVHLPRSLNPGHRVGFLLSQIAAQAGPLASFDSLLVPFRCVATNLVTGERAVLANGSLVTALRATMAIPGAFDPVWRDGALLADGGVVDNLPVDVARALGADRVVAIDVSGVTGDSIPESLSGLTGRAVAIALAVNQRPALAAADIVITPDLRDFGMSDYAASESLVTRGYQAAARMADKLLPLALDPHAWDVYLAMRHGRHLPREPVPIGAVFVDGVPGPVARQLTAKLGSYIGAPLDDGALQQDLDRLIGQGRYASASYELEAVDSQARLRVGVQAKPHAPPSMRLGLHIADEHGDVAFDLGARVTYADPMTAGSELRLDAGFGTNPRLAGELYQPLHGGSVLSPGGLFIAPRAYALWKQENFYDAGKRVAEYRRRRIGAGLDLGWIASNVMEARLGYDIAAVQDERSIGDPQLEEGDGREQRATFALELDTAHSATIPRRGLRASTETAWFVEALNATDDFGQTGARCTWFQPFRAHDRAFATVLAGATFGGGTPPPLGQFILGGSQRLEVFGPGELRADNVALGRLGYLVALRRLGSVGDDRLYLTCALESGSAFQMVSQAQAEWSTTVGIAADTPVGPVLAGVSLGTAGRWRLHLTIGEVLR